MKNDNSVQLKVIKLLLITHTHTQTQTSQVDDFNAFSMNGKTQEFEPH